MPLPPIKISDAVQKAAYDDLAKGSMRQFGDALAVIVKRVLDPHRKSAEELALDWQTGEEASENRRRLAAEALDRVPIEHRVFPARQIAGRILRDSEFELPETPIWGMWSQLLSRASDKRRLLNAHPAFPGIISQLSPQEAELLRLIMVSKIADPLRYWTKSWTVGEDEIMEYNAVLSWKPKLEFFPGFHFGVAHLAQLDLIEIHAAGTTAEPGLYGHPEITRAEMTCHLTWWGSSFMEAVTEPATDRA